MKTITLTYVIAFPAIQTIATGFVLIGLARAVQLLLLILVTSYHVAGPIAP